MCVVCREEYNSDHRIPVMLPHCGHTFCRPCITHLINTTQGAMFCPTCRKRHRTHYGELPINYALLGLVEKTKKSKYGSCRKHGNPLEFWCCHCPEALCGHCLYEGHMGHGDDVIMAHELIEKSSEHTLPDTKVQPPSRLLDKKPPTVISLVPATPQNCKSSYIPSSLLHQSEHIMEAIKLCFSADI